MQSLPTYLVAILIGLALAGCAGSGGSGQGSKPSATKQSPTTFGASSNPEVVQRDIMNFADRFTSCMADTYDQVAAAKTSTPAAQNAAMERKVGNAMAAYTNATEFSPIVGLIDMMVMTRLLRESSEEPWFTEVFGATESATITTALKSQEADIWSIGARYLTEAQQNELRDAIERWRKSHPDQRYVASIRLADFPEAKSPPTASAKGPTSVFSLLFLDPLAGVEPAKQEIVRSRESAERMFFYAQRMPVLLAWQSESLSHRVMDAPRMQQFGNGAARFGDFADSARMIGEALKRFPITMAEERQRTVDLLAQKLTEQRAAAVRQFALALGVVVTFGVLLTAAAVLIIRRKAPAPPPPARPTDYKPVGGYIVERGMSDDDIRITKTE